MNVYNLIELWTEKMLNLRENKVQRLMVDHFEFIALADVICSRFFIEKILQIKKKKNFLSKKCWLIMKNGALCLTLKSGLIFKKKVL